MKHVFEKGEFVFVVLQSAENTDIRLIFFGKVIDHFPSTTQPNPNGYGYCLEDITVLWQEGFQRPITSVHQRWVEREPIERQDEVKPRIPNELRKQWLRFKRKLNAKAESFIFR